MSTKAHIHCMRQEKDPHMPPKATHENTNPLFPLSPTAVRKLLGSDDAQIPVPASQNEKFS